MAFSTTHADGSMDQPGDPTTFASLLDELDEASAEHADIAVSHESGWTLTVLAHGRVVWEDVEEGDAPRHLEGLAPQEILELMTLVAAGRIDAVDEQPWRPGYGP